MLVGAISQIPSGSNTGLLKENDKIVVSDCSADMLNTTNVPVLPLLGSGDTTPRIL
jgi:hypothetical protein